MNGWMDGQWEGLMHSPVHKLDSGWMDGWWMGGWVVVGGGSFDLPCACSVALPYYLVYLVYEVCTSCWAPSP